MDLKEINITNKNHNRHPWEQARLKVIFSLLSGFLSKEKEAVVLDIGSGDMYVAGALSKLFPNTTFICVDTGYEQTIFKTDYNLTIYKSLSEFKSSCSKRVDIIMLLDVIEHIEDEIVFIEELGNESFITFETRFIVTVPSFSSLYSSHDHYLNHYRRYSYASLKHRLNEAGLTIIKSNYFFFSLLLPRKWLQWREKQNLYKGFTGVGRWQGGPLITTFLKAILFIDYKVGQFASVTGIKLPGLSLYAICQKSA
ncbi:MAG TPA: hypothetical protein VFN30_09910 [Chitinophagaceae bacterium]|nr:hypothetical protein [Chitinophagaceae bacterium]